MEKLKISEWSNTFEHPLQALQVLALYYDGLMFWARIHSCPDAPQFIRVLLLACNDFSYTRLYRKVEPFGEV